MPAATALARGRSGGRLRTVRLAAIRYDSETIYRFLFVPPGTGPPERAAQATLRSFRKLSRADAAQLAPRRLRLYTVTPGDTQKALARRLPFERLALKRLRVLNGLQPGQALPPGRRIKLVR
jgi:predicted Zn-dependent protease